MPRIDEFCITHGTDQLYLKSGANVPDCKECEFHEWFAAVDEFGYAPNEWPGTAWPERWRKYFDAGLTPQQAYNQAADEADEAARQRRADAAERWRQIQARDAASAVPTGSVTATDRSPTGEAK